MINKHANIAAKFIRDEKRTDWHNQAVWNFRQKRDLMAHSIPEWELLRTLASDIKSNVLGQLDEYLLEFERNAEQNGVQIHWASDAASHNKIVGGILDKHSIKHVVKSKSMLTEECGLNDYLEKKGVEVIDTDLGERIIQLRGGTVCLDKSCNFLNGQPRLRQNMLEHQPDMDHFRPDLQRNVAATGRNIVR